MTNEELIGRLAAIEVRLELIDTAVQHMVGHMTVNQASEVADALRTYASSLADESPPLSAHAGAALNSQLLSLLQALGQR